MRNVNIYMYEDIQELYSKKKKQASKSLNPNIFSGFQAGESSSNSIDNSLFQEILSTNKKRSSIQDAESNTDGSKRQRKITTLDEHNILDPLVEMDKKPTESQIMDAIRRTGWERKKLVDYIYQHRKRKNK